MDFADCPSFSGSDVEMQLPDSPDGGRIGEHDLGSSLASSDADMGVASDKEASEGTSLGSSSQNDALDRACPRTPRRGPQWDPCIKT